MTSNCGDILNLKALLEQSAGGLMAEIMETQIVKPGSFYCTIERLGDRVRSDTEYVPI